MSRRSKFNVALVFLVLCSGLLACNSKAEDEATQICLSQHPEGSPEFEECMTDALGEDE